MQRVAISRSLAANPSLIFADEPTGNLDSKTAKEILDLFKKLAFEKGHTIVMVTHDMSLMNYGHRVIKIKDGEIEEDRRVVNQ